jgi:hypothetical protein
LVEPWGQSSTVLQTICEQSFAPLVLEFPLQQAAQTASGPIADAPVERTTPCTKHAVAPPVQPLAGMGGLSHDSVKPWSGTVQVRPA